MCRDQAQIDSRLCGALPLSAVNRVDRYLTLSVTCCSRARAAARHTTLYCITEDKHKDNTTRDSDKAQTTDSDNAHHLLVCHTHPPTHNTHSACRHEEAS